MLFPTFEFFAFFENRCQFYFYFLIQLVDAAEKVRVDTIFHHFCTIFDKE